MNGGPMFILICIEIVAITVVLHFLAKVGLSKGLKWAGNMLLIVGFLILACTVTRGIIGMVHHDKDGMGQCCPMGGRHWHDGCMMHDGCCGHDGCRMDGDMKDGKCKMDSAKGGKCCMDKDGKGMEKEHKDSTKGK